MCLSRAINSPMIHALDMQQTGILQDMLGLSTGTETENLYLLCQEVARQRKGDTQKDNSDLWKKNHCNWIGNPCLAGRGTGGEGNEADISSEGGRETGIRMDSSTS